MPQDRDALTFRASDQRRRRGQAGHPVTFRAQDGLLLPAPGAPPGADLVPRPFVALWTSLSAGVKMGGCRERNGWMTDPHPSLTEHQLTMIRACPRHRRSLVELIDRFDAGAKAHRFTLDPGAPPNARCSSRRAA
jgi:hypothetical protein